MFGQGFTCPALLVFTPRRVSRTGLSPCAAGLSSPFRYPTRRLRAFPLSLAATRGISVDFFSSGYLDVSVPPVRFLTLCIQVRIVHKCTGFPHSDIVGYNGSYHLTDAFRRLARPSSPLIA